MIGEIANDVSIGLKNANSPLGLMTDSARSNGRDTGGAKHDSGIGQVGGGIDHRHAHSVHHRCRQTD